MKMQNIGTFLKNRWFMISLAIVLLSSAGIFVWARYVNANNSMKRTIVSLAETDEKRFTSNLLFRTIDLTEKPSPKTYPVSDSALDDSGEYYKLPVIIRIYSPSDTNHYYCIDTLTFT